MQKEMTMQNKMLTAFRAARRVSTPIVAIQTPDASATIDAIQQLLGDNVPLIQWDATRGLRGLNERGAAVPGVGQPTTVNPVEALIQMEQAPSPSAVFMHNAHRFLNDIAFVQAVWNLRDVFKVDRRTLILLGPTFHLPAELAGDVIVIDEPLPTRDELGETLKKQCENAKRSVASFPMPDEAVTKAALDAVIGLPAYTAEQVIAMSLERTGLDVPNLWERKIKAIENTDGLSVWVSQPGDTTLDELKGLDNVVAFGRKLQKANSFNAIVFIDEGDKAFAGGMSDYSGDSGVAKDQTGTILSYVQNTKSKGMMLAGLAGTGKSQFAKAIAAACGKPLIVFDLGAMKGGVVGESERKIREALKMVTATAEGRVLFIMTANKTVIFTPELNRRFPDQFYFDQPDDAGTEEIAQVYYRKTGLSKKQQAPAGYFSGWTGAEIQRAIERAAEFSETVQESGRFVIPQSISQKDELAKMRQHAHGRFLSASKPGYYEAPEALRPAAVKAAPGVRNVDLN